MFRIGQKVVCVAHFPRERRMAWATYAEKNQVYTVRGYVIRTDGVECLLLNEIHNPPRPSRIGIVEFGFRANYFRPIVERKTDISVFVEILRRESVPDECAPAAVYGVDWGASA